jgi:hypothetical protein
MHAFVMAMICVAMLANHLKEWLGLSPVIGFLPEILTFAAVPIVFVLGVQNRFRFVAGHYWLGFGLLLFVIVGSSLANDVEAGPTIAGMRYYLRAIPFFFLPAVCNFTDRQLKQQFNLLLLLAFVQIPIAAYQRWVVLSEGRFTGDDVFGTLEVSHVLSVFLISVVLVVIGLALRKRVGKVKAVLICFVLLIPTMLNETKATVILLPVGLFVALMIGAQRGRRLALAAWTAVLLAAFGTVFVVVYDAMDRNRPWTTPLAEFFTDPEKFNRYMESRDAGVGATFEVGRKDSITIPLQYLANEPTRLVFGLGMGSVSQSQLGDRFTGEYFQLFRNIAVSSGTVFLLEIGLLGIAGVLLLNWLIFRDALALAREDSGMRGALAIGWAGVAAVFALATFYTTVHTFESLAYLFWYFSGVVAVRRLQLTAGTSPAPASGTGTPSFGVRLPAMTQPRLRH